MLIRLLYKAMEFRLSKLSREDAEGLLVHFVHFFIRGKAPDEALKFLFNLDEKLYALQGKMSVAYGGGIHTKHRHIKYHDFFTERIAEGETVLDVGCGHGALAYSIASKTGANVTGIDLSADNIRMARERHAHTLVNFLQGDALRDLPSGHYDVVVLSNVLEHIQERITFLAGLMQEATPQRLLVRVPMFERDWRVPLKQELGVEWRLDRTHFTEYTIESFVKEVTAAGLKICDQELRWGELWCVLEKG